MSKMALGRAVLLAASIALLSPAAAVGADAELECGAVVTADTTLTGNVDGCSGVGITVSAGATLDMAGHRVTGGTGATSGVEVGPGATVRGGTVSGFRNGVITDGGTVTGMVLRGNEWGVRLDDASQQAATITRSQITGNAAGIAAGSARNFSIVRNRITDNTRDGVVASSSNDGALYRDNRILRNGGYGLFVSDSTSRIVGNRASWNGADGIYVAEALAGYYAGYFLADNTANHNARLGIRVVPNLSGERPVDGGGNTARHNGDPLQCLNVACG
jgi:Periplasmic copper-binding protein (NosD)